MNEVLENFSFMCLPRHDFQSATNNHKNLIWAQTRSNFEPQSFNQVAHLKWAYFGRLKYDDLISWRNHKNRFYRRSTGDLLNFKGTLLISQISNFRLRYSKPLNISIFKNQIRFRVDIIDSPQLETLLGCLPSVS